MPVDFHTHTARCGHAGGETRAYVEAALRAGLSEIAITDHLFLYDRPADRRDPRFAMREEELPGYVDEVRSLRDEFAGRIEVRLGIEADYFEGHEGTLGEILGRYDWDVVLGSVHWVDGDWVDFSAERMESGDPAALWGEYWRLLEKACATGLFDVMTHFDLPKKFGHHPPAELADARERAVLAAAAADLAVEVSSAGLRKPVGEIYPGPELLRLLVHYGVPLTLSSDAHAPAEVGWGYDRLRRALALAGVERVAGFSKRRRHLRLLGDPGEEANSPLEPPLL